MARPEPDRRLEILALEPYYGGSHRAFLDGWRGLSRHRWTFLTLPPYKWKWRMRHGPVTLAAALRALPPQRWDRLVASDMLDLAALRGLAPRLADVPTVVYFHENQLTYPVRRGHGGDGHFAFTNFTSALAAHRVWFNSAFHRDELLAAWRAWLRRFPDHQPLAEVDEIARRARVEPPGIMLPPARRGEPSPGPLKVLWAARWEHDKAPEVFFAAVDGALARGADLRLAVVGESFRERPKVFDEARRSLGDRVEVWGWQRDRAAYDEVLAWADVFVSTARHEFFGLSAVEAVAAGAFPLLPDRLAYPEVFEGFGGDIFYGSGTAEEEVERVAQRLVDLDRRHRAGSLWPGEPDFGRRAMERFGWEERAAAMDQALEEVAAGHREGPGS